MEEIELLYGWPTMERNRRSGRRDRGSGRLYGWFNNERNRNAMWLVHLSGRPDPGHDLRPEVDAAVHEALEGRCEVDGRKKGREEVYGRKEGRK